MDDIRDFHWTSTGASHLSKGMRCEDASLSISRKDYVIAAVADGHGASYCYRSHLGAKIAVDTAWKTLQILMQEGRHEDLRKWLLVPSSRNRLYHKIAALMSENWKQQCVRHLQENPATFQEIEGCHLYLANTISDMNSCLVYGCTLLFAAMNESILLLGQQGDGRICVLYADGTMNMPVPWDSRCVDNVTTSLCDPDVDESMRFTWIDLEKKPVAAVFLVSDGIEDSFDSFQGLYDFLLELLDGYYHHRSDFERFLSMRFAALSARGSFDDSSAAGFINTKLLGDIFASLERKVRFNKNKEELVLIRHQLDELKARSSQESDPEVKSMLDSLYSMGLSTYAGIREKMNEAYEEMKKGTQS